MQMSDWRVRPLTTKMLEYARNDTHYLLKLYDLMRKDLIARSVVRKRDKLYSLLNKVFKESKEVSLLTYRKPSLKDPGYMLLVHVFNRFHNKKEVKILKILLKWRDYIARIEDKSREFIAVNTRLTEMVEAKDNLKEQIVTIPLFTKYTNDILSEIELKTKKYN
jgi:exosome complex exonuclease RRP6